MTLDREFQNTILRKAAECYPNEVPYEEQLELFEGIDEHVVIANAFYLQEHGLLVDGSVQNAYFGYHVASLKCTHTAMDFLRGDGGLTAILGTVTVRIHEDTLREILEAKIFHSDLPPTEKTGLLESLKQLPADSIKHLTMSLLDKAVASTPAAIALISSYLQQS